MKPYAFELRIPRSVDEAIETLSEHGEEAKLLAGGQSIVPMMNLRMAQPEMLIDLNRIEELQGIAIEGDGSLRCGAMTRHRVLEDHSSVRRSWRLLDDAVPHIGHVGIRNRGTIGGSIAHADPAAELPAVCLAIEARFLLRGPRGSREIAASNFFEMTFTTALESDEVLTDVIVPPVPDGTGEAWIEFARRHGDFALIGVAARVAVDSGGSCTKATLALAGAASVPTLVPGLEPLVVGRRADESLWTDLAEHAAESASPRGDLHAPKEYRTHLIRVLAERALDTAARRAEQAGGDRYA